jgi:adenine deaminase
LPLGKESVVTRADLLAVARGEKNADYLLRNGRLVNVFSGEIEEVDIAIAGDQIAGIGAGYSAVEEVDLAGAYVAPGLLDGHVHIESSLCLPAHFAAAVVPRGVTTAVIDPHEIANVVGMAGVRFMAESSRNLPLNVVVMAPSCVPATHMETNGATLGADELATLLSEGTVYGLAELMNFPGAVNGAQEVLAKVAAFRGRPIDGHAPALSGQALNAYAALGVGSEHECTSVEEATEKLARGFYILVREATNARNLHTLLPLINERNHRRICFCTDDRVPGDLLDQGSIDYMVREAIAYGIDPITAIRMATLNTAEWFGLHDRGAIAPGRVADLILFDDLRAPHIRQVYAAGRLVAEDGQLVDKNMPSMKIPAALRRTMQVDWSRLKLRIPATGEQVRVIVSLPDQLVTEDRIISAPVRDGEVVAAPDDDLLKMAVIDRHQASGATGLGLIAGIGLRYGAIAGTIAHDHHNLVIIGADDDSMLAAAKAVGSLGGGLAVALGNEILASLPLPVAGLMSDRPIAEVRTGYDSVISAARVLGSELHDPFMAMSFMALEVIPKLKLTDHGLVDVEQFAVVDLFV